MGVKSKNLAASTHLYGQNKKTSPARGAPGPTLPISAGAPADAQPISVDLFLVINVQSVRISARASPGIFPEGVKVVFLEYPGIR